MSPTCFVTIAEFASVRAVMTTCSAIPTATLPPFAHSITETCVEAAWFQISVVSTWVPAALHVDVLLAAEGPVPMPAAAHVAAVRPLTPDV